MPSRVDVDRLDAGKGRWERSGIKVGRGSLVKSIGQGNLLLGEGIP